MIRAAVMGGLVVILVAAGALGVRLYQARAEALELIRLGDQQFREGHYLKALETYQRSNALKASPHAEERIRLAQETLRAQRAPLRPPTQTAGLPGTPAAPTPAPASAPGSTGAPLAASTASPGPPPGEQAVGSRKTAEQVRRLLREGRFGEVQDLMSQLIRDKRQTRHGYLYASSVVHHSLLVGDTWQNKADLMPHLDLWVQQSNASSMALTFRGAFHGGTAWKARGQGWASTVTERGWKVMREHLALATRDLEAAHASDAGNPLPPILMTAAARTMGAAPESLDLHFRRALEYDARLYEPYLFKLEYLKPKWGGSEAAMFAFARDSLRNAPKGSAIPNLLGDAHAEKGQYLVDHDRQYLNGPEVWSEIDSVYGRLLGDFPQSGLWPVEYAMLAKRAGRLEEAKKYFDLALERDPGEFDVRYERGRFFEEAIADLPLALAEYSEAARLEPFSIKALTRQGGLLYRTNQWPKAIAAYSTLIKLDPENPRVHFQRASSYYMLKQYQEAVLDYSQAIALKPDYKLAYRWRAACYERLGMPDKQQADLRILQSLPE